MSSTVLFNFIHINKTAGTSVKRALKLPPSNHKTASEIIKVIGIEQWENSFNFTVVRNPWDKVTSHYFHRVKTNQTGLKEAPIDFNEWVKLTYGCQDERYYNNPKMFMPQLDWITAEDDAILVDFICQFESLKEDFLYVCERLGVNATLPHEKSTCRESYNKYYNQESMDIIADWFEKDIQKFGYTF